MSLPGSPVPAPLTPPTIPAPVWTGIRYVVAISGPVFGVIGFIAHADPAQVQHVVEGIKKLADDSGVLIQDLLAVWAYAWPLISGAMLALGINSATVANRLTGVLRTKGVKINGTIEAPSAIANAVPSAQVVPSPIGTKT